MPHLQRVAEGGVDAAAAGLEAARRLSVGRQALAQQLRRVKQVAPQHTVGGNLRPARVLHRRLIQK